MAHHSEARKPTLDFVDLLFIGSFFLAPLEIKVVASLTVYDLVIALIAFLILVGPRRLQILPRAFLPAVYIFLLSAVISTLRAPHPMESITQIVQFAFIFFVQIPVILTLTKSSFVLRSGLLLFFAGALVGAVWAATFQQVQGAGRTLVFYSDNPNRLGYPTAYLLPFALFLALDGWRRRSALVSWVVAGAAIYLLVWALAASGSRSATVGMLVGLLAYLTFRNGLRVNWRIPARVVVVIAVIALLGYALYQSPYLPMTLRERVDRTMTGESTLVDDRRRLAEAGLMAFEASPLVGVGFDNFRYVAKDYLASATNQVPHNIWIQFLSQVGLFGTLAFAYLMAAWFAMMVRAQDRTQDRSLRDLIWVLIAAMAAVMTIFLFLPIMDQRQYWLLYGTGLAVAIELLTAPAISPPAKAVSPLAAAYRGAMVANRTVHRRQGENAR